MLLRLMVLFLLFFSQSVFADYKVIMSGTELGDKISIPEPPTLKGCFYSESNPRQYWHFDEEETSTACGFNCSTYFGGIYNKNIMTLYYDNVVIHKESNWSDDGRARDWTDEFSSIDYDGYNYRIYKGDLKYSATIGGDTVKRWEICFDANL